MATEQTFSQPIHLRSEVKSSDLRSYLPQLFLHNQSWMASSQTFCPSRLLGGLWIVIFSPLLQEYDVGDLIEKVMAMLYVVPCFKETTI